jgi:cytochrome c peroxidase
MPLLVEKLKAVDFYPPLFEAAFGTPEINPDRITNALSQFLRSLIGFDTRFDKAYHLMSPDDEPHPEAVLTAQELRGADIFNGSGHCFLCHSQGAQTMDRLTNDALDVEPLDPGDGNGNFRTTSLRNVAVTAPYMHDGSIATLREVVELYNRGGEKNPWLDPKMKPLNLTREEIDALVAFMQALEGEGYQDTPPASFPQ